MASDDSLKTLKIIGEVMGDEFVTLYVGLTRKKFIVHKNLICDVSDFFKKSFTGNFLEGQEGTMSLEEDSPAVISLFIHWLYSSAVPLGNSETYLHNPCDLYLFADKMCLPILKDTTMDSIQDMSLKHNLLDALVAPALVGKVLKALPSRDKGLRRFCTDVLVQTCFRRAKPAPHEDNKSDDDYEEVGEEGDEYDGVVYLKKSDVMNLWDLCKDDAKFFHAVLDKLGQEMQRQIRDGDPEPKSFEHLERDETYQIDCCWYHCHTKDFDCRAKLDDELPRVEIREGKKACAN